MLLTHQNIFQWDDPARLLVGRVFEVVQTVVVQNEPAALPALVAPALLPQPAFLIRVEESVHQVVTIILRYLKRLRSDRFVERLEQLARQIAAVVDTAIHRDELLDGGLVLDGRIVERRVQHDDGEAEHVTSVRVGEDVRVQLTIALGEALHHAVDFLRLAGQPKAP